MKKPELIKKLKQECHLDSTEAAFVVNTFFNDISNALARGERVEIRGLWTFFIKKYEGYIGRNPKTGEKVQVAPKKMPFFKCGKELKERINEKVEA